MHPWILSAPSRSRWGLPRNSLSAAPLRMKDISAIDREGGAVGASRDAETAKASRMSAWLSEGPEGSRVAPSVASRAFLEGPQAAAEAPDRNAWPAGLEGLAASRGTPVASVGGLKRAEGPGGSQCLAGMEDRLAEVGDGADRHAGGEATEHLGSWELVDSQVRMWGWGGWQRGAAGDAGGAAGGGAEEEERGGEKQAVEVDDGPDMAQAVKDLLFWLQPRGQAWLQDFADGAFVMVGPDMTSLDSMPPHPFIVAPPPTACAAFVVPLLPLLQCCRHVDVHCMRVLPAVTLRPLTNRTRCFRSVGSRHLASPPASHSSLADVASSDTCRWKASLPTLRPSLSMAAWRS